MTLDKIRLEKLIDETKKFTKKKFKAPKGVDIKAFNKEFEFFYYDFLSPHIEQAIIEYLGFKEDEEEALEFIKKDEND